MELYCYSDDGHPDMGHHQFNSLFWHWDPYPFILLNLLFSVQAAYAAPIIMMAQNSQSARDRVQAYGDYRTNIEAKEEIEGLQLRPNRIETEKLDKIMEMLHAIKMEKDDSACEY
ncbi:DUF1003 domain-containing protein [Arachidicoccus sp.]|jgi:uncharacterized membrane protein|uniref:DUF1003 domain-containing protein n=1 Tax=Arachidicoccus sp. TaxID=1872624 RepID=UPI003D1C0903